MKNQLSKNQKSKLIKIAKEYKLDLLVLFGSRATGRANKNSDFDLAFLKFSLSESEEILLFDEIGNIFEEKAFDLINLKKNHSVVLRQQIFQHGICLYESFKYLFEKEKEYVYFDYIDSFALLNPNKEKFISNTI